MKILVVGGAGYIGFEVATHLASTGHEVWSLDTNNARSVQLISYKVKTLVDSVENVRTGSAVLQTFDAVINLTGGVDDAGIWDAIQPPQLLAVPLLRAACPSARIIHISTQYVFGVAEFNKERNKLSPQCNYGMTHCMAEAALVSDKNAIILRFGTVWGSATFTRWDTWGNHFQRAITQGDPLDLIFPKDLICLLSIKNAVAVISWALEVDAPGIFHVADEIGFREDLAEKLVEGRAPITHRPRNGGVSVGMNCTKVSRAGFSFGEVDSGWQ